MAADGLKQTDTSSAPMLAKAPTGIAGLDDVLGGGLPRGRPTLVTGPSGCGKTLLGLEFLVRGALEQGEPGVLVTFEESATELAANVASLGWDLHRLQSDGMLFIDAFRFDPSQFVEAGAYDLEGLFVRLGYAIQAVGAKRVLLDTIEVLFGPLAEETVRAELGRLFEWLRERGLTAVVTGEAGTAPGRLTRHGIEEYVSDCVIVLDHRVRDELSTRRLRVLKYRGSLHGTNEYPFLITERGLSVLPITSVGLTYDVSSERVPTGINRLDHMLGGGVFRGSTMLVTGEAGTGKTLIASRVAEATCARGERALFVSFEESPAQLMRNMASVGIDLSRWVDAGLLRIWAGRPGMYGLELHLAMLSRLVGEFEPSLVVLDAMTALEHVGPSAEVTSAVTREVDVLKARGVTTVVTSLTHSVGESSSMAVTSLMDTWLLVRSVETNGERNRLLFVRKSRGSAHSNQVREFVITNAGLDLLDVYVGPRGVLTGSARLTQEAEERRAKSRNVEEAAIRRRARERRAAEIDAQIAALRAELAAETVEVEDLEARAVEETADLRDEAGAMAGHRWADTPHAVGAPGGDDGRS